MRSFSCMSIALAMAFSCAAAYADNGTILFSRPVNGTSNGVTTQVGSGLFVIHDNGTGYRQLTPMVANAYYMPSGVAYPTLNTVGTGSWLTKNFSADGQHIQFFSGKSTNPSDGPYTGKYYVANLLTGSTQTLFTGTNDNAAPGHGYLAWGPVGSNEIAYSNSTSELPTSPPCVQVMHTDGSDQHTLWCAPATLSITQGDVPSLAISGIRWAGNGKSLLAYVSYQPVPLAVPRKAAVQRIGYTGFAALYKVNVQTGAATLIAPDVPDPGVADISYDGNVVLYQQEDLFHCGDGNLESTGVSLCVKNLTTGVVTSVFPKAGTWDLQGTSGWWMQYWYSQALLSPDGSKVAVTMQLNDSPVNEADLYVVNADGTGLRQLTKRDANAAASAQIAWIPVAWSPDGYQLLANRATGPVGGKDQTTSSEVHVIALSNGRDWRVTTGYAVDWRKGPCL